MSLYELRPATEGYLELSQTSKIGENSQWLLPAKYFRKKAPS